MTICGLDFCKDCGNLRECGGCRKCAGHPMGGTCIAADAISAGGQEAFAALKRDLVDDINALNIPGLHVDDLNPLSGYYVNLEYSISNGSTVKFLNDRDIYLGSQILRECSDRCYGVVACGAFILVCEYGCDGSDPEIVLYKRR